MINKLGELNIVSISDHKDLVAVTTLAVLEKLQIDQFGVTEIDPQYSDTAAFCDHYKVAPDQTINCVIVKATRADKNWFAACLIRATTKADVNGLVRRHLDARKASFAPMNDTVELTKMEYGGITAVGLPNAWPIIVDKAVADLEQAIIGSGIRKSKLITSGKVLSSLPNAVVLEGVGMIKNHES